MGPLPYRAYVFDDNDHTIKVVVIEADTDEQAGSTATDLLDVHDIEVWQGDRLVARLLHSATD